MSTQYKKMEEVPTAALADRLMELSRFVAANDFSDFSMRVPAELDRDADVVMSGAALRLLQLEQELEQERKRLDWALKHGAKAKPGNLKWKTDACEHSCSVLYPRAKIDKLMKGEGW